MNQIKLENLQNLLEWEYSPLKPQAVPSYKYKKFQIDEITTFCLFSTQNNNLNRNCNPLIIKIHKKISLGVAQHKHRKSNNDDHQQCHDLHYNYYIYNWLWWYFSLSLFTNHHPSWCLSWAQCMKIYDNKKYFVVN